MEIRKKPKVMIKNRLYMVNNTYWCNGIRFNGSKLKEIILVYKGKSYDGIAKQTKDILGKSTIFIEINNEEHTLDMLLNYPSCSVFIKNHPLQRKKIVINPFVANVRREIKEKIMLRKSQKNILANKQSST